MLLTDLADLPPHFWIEPGVDGVIVGTDEAVRQARALGLPEERIHRVSGMVLHPRFYAQGGGDARVRARARAGRAGGGFHGACSSSAARARRRSSRSLASCSAPIPRST